MAQRQTNRSVNQNRQSGNRPMYMCLLDLQQKSPIQSSGEKNECRWDNLIFTWNKKDPINNRLFFITCSKNNLRLNHVYKCER